MVFFSVFIRCLCRFLLNQLCIGCAFWIVWTSALSGIVEDLVGIFPSEPADHFYLAHSHPYSDQFADFIAQKACWTNKFISISWTDVVFVHCFTVAVEIRFEAVFFSGLEKFIQNIFTHGDDFALKLR